MILGVHHASITSADVDRLAAFYCDHLGFEVAMRTEWGAGNTGADAIYGLSDTAVKMVMMRGTNCFLELFQFESPAGKPCDPQRPVNDQGYTHICIAVADIEAEYVRLSEAGMKFNCPPQTARGLCRATYGRDPDGNIVELMEADPDGPFAIGAIGLAA